jgi:DNA repair protein RecN (Recombination protein N)
MLHELRVENLLLLQRAELRLAPGLNVLTGETGAGKTLLAHALDLLLGGRARPGIVRPGADEAYVEGVFDLPPGLGPELSDRLPSGGEEIVLARRVWADGRTRAYVCGRSATVGDLQALGQRLLSFYGQHEHRKLTLGAAQLEVLDAHCGKDHLALRARLAELYARVRKLEARAQELRDLAGARDRELDLLAFEIDEIEAAEPSEQEEAELVAERDRVRNTEALRAGAAAAADAIAPDVGVGAAELLVTATRALEPLASLDGELAVQSERLAGLRYEAEDLGGELRRYALQVEDSPAQLEEIEERLALLARLQRKHGGSIRSVLAHADRSRTRRAELEGAEVALEQAENELGSAGEELDRLAARLSATRTDTAPRFARAVGERLAELAMGDAAFEVRLEPRADGCGPRGSDSVELRLAPNAGVPAGPLRELASGGELSRVMLAVLSVAHTAGAAADSPLLVFDEVDAGIGGHTARAVGEHLRTLAAERQILCITHLPQVASLAECHFRIEKETVDGSATTTVSVLAGEAVVGELVRMLGAGEGDRAASQHARSLLRAA